MKAVLTAVIGFMCTATMVLGQTCTLTFAVQIEAPHGTLTHESTLTGTLTYSVERQMRMGSEAMAYFTDGEIQVSAADSTALNGRLGVIHVVRSPHWADYISFDITDVAGDLGGVTAYENPMLLSFYAERGSLASFDLPMTLTALDAFDRRRTFQVHTPDTMWTLPGTLLEPSLSCSSP